VEGYKFLTQIRLFWLMKGFLLGVKRKLLATDHWPLITTPVPLLLEPFPQMIAT
jgi:hypothetical protein